MKASTFHQAVGALYCAGRKDLAISLSYSAGNIEKAVRNGDSPNLIGRTVRLRDQIWNIIGVKNGNFQLVSPSIRGTHTAPLLWLYQQIEKGRVKILASKTADIHGRLMELEQQLKAATSPERKKMLAEKIKSLKGGIEKKAKEYESKKKS